MWIIIESAMGWPDEPLNYGFFNKFEVDKEIVKLEREQKGLSVSRRVRYKSMYIKRG